ncbi:MAG TPA: hypothetical protein DDX01_02450, partial [Holosporales bacterium]|nr:hypothetical protein [Holosporales bacterium]
MLVSPLLAMEEKDSNRIPSSHYNSAFIAKQGDKIIIAEGPYEERHPPFSTFKTTLALMAFDVGFFQTSNFPTFSFKEEYEKNFQNWNPAYTRRFLDDVSR